jgi:hypothetical protein
LPKLPELLDDQLLEDLEELKDLKSLHELEVLHKLPHIYIDEGDLEEAEIYHIQE